MRVECDKCGRIFDDEFRSWNCPGHELIGGRPYWLASGDPEPVPGDTRPTARAIVLGVLLVAGVIAFAWGVSGRLPWVW